MKVLIVEDQFEIADSYRRALGDANIVSDIAGTGAEAINKFKQGNYDVVLLDINLPDMSGISILEQIRGEQSTVGIIMITARTEDELIVSSLGLGADDYLQKPVKYTELVARINSVFRRYNLQTAVNKEVGNLEVDYSRNLIYINQEEVRFTNKEYLLISKLVNDYPGYCSTDTLTNAIYDEYVTESSAIRVHVYNLKRKLEKYQIIIENNKVRGYRLCFPQQNQE